MAIAFVQDDAIYEATSTDSVAKAFTSNNTAGNLIIVAVGAYYHATATATCADSAGNTYAVAQGPTRNASWGSNPFTYIFYAKNCVGGANTVTVTFSTAVDEHRMTILEYSGADTTAPLDVSASTAALFGDTDLASSSATTNANNELIFGLSTCSAADIAAGAGLTARQKPDAYLLPMDKILVTAGSTSVTASASFCFYITTMATFKEAAAGRAAKNTRTHNLGTELGMDLWGGDRG